VQFINNNWYLVKWREHALAKGYVILGDISVRDFRGDATIPQGQDLIRVWIKVFDMPHC
jgi:hypothetical protein